MHVSRVGLGCNNFGRRTDAEQTRAYTEQALAASEDISSDDDRAITEKKRLLAEIDFPRPEIILNAWSFQASSSDPRTVGIYNQALRQFLDGFNDALQAGILRAWQTIQPEAAR